MNEVMKRGRRCRTGYCVLLFGVAITCFQLLLCLTQVASLKDLNHWDSGWYQCIARFGYQTELPPKPQNCGSNVAFFPAYPYLARWISQWTGISVDVALLAVSWISASAMWTYLLLLLNRLHLSRILQVAVVALLVCHPAAFFLVAGYSESLFLAMFLGYLYWQLEPRGRGMSWAVGHGFVMGATRIVGIAWVAFPLLTQLIARGGGRRAEVGYRLPAGELPGSVMFFLAPLMGTFSFFCYTWAQFGVFDLYLQTGRIGWGIMPNYLAFFSLELLQFTPFSPGNPDHWSRLMIPLTLWSLLTMAAMEAVLWRWRRQASIDLLRFRLPLYGGIIAMLYLVVSSRAGLEFQSVLRYHLGWYFPQMLCLGSLLQDMAITNKRSVALSVLLGTVIAAGILLYVQLHFLARFGAGHWVA